jgi:phytoene dehydrogenase-like protein
VNSGGPLDAVVVGAGPNGLAAAVELARNGCSVLVCEASETIGGGARTQELTLPGFHHDVCSAIHPLGVASPFFESLSLDVDWVQPKAPLAHPLDDGTAVMLQGSIEDTAAGLGADSGRYQRLVRWLVKRRDEILETTLSPFVPRPRRPVAGAMYGALVLASAVSGGRALLRTERARALIAGTAAHAMLPLRSVPAHGLWPLFHMCAHTTGWPMPRGGSQAIPDALAVKLRSLGGEIECGRPVRSLADLPPSRVALFDVTPKQLARITGDALPSRYLGRLESFRYGPGVFKIDYALDAPIPWKAPEAAEAGTLHIGGTYGEVAASEKDAVRGRHSDRPWVIVGQQSLFDPTRAPAGKHTAWMYCHVPHGSTKDMTGTVEDQIERFAPGFRDIVLARATKSPADLEGYNENYVGGDIAGGWSNLRQFIMRPVPGLRPYQTPNPRLFLCSSSTPPGPGVHGMCGYHAARAALRELA